MLSSGKLSKHSLCGLHAILRSFLDGCGAKEELSRHLPSAKKMKNIISNQSKVSNSNNAEMAIEFVRITATSALLQELLGGKLAATIRAFCRRAAADARMQSSKHSKNTVPSPDATKLDAIANARALKENNKQREELSRDVALSQHVFRTESDVAEELRRLCALGVFPQAELQSIRETYNELDRERVRLLSLKGRGDRNMPGVGAEEAELSSSEKTRLDESGRSQSSVRSEGELELEFCKRKLAILRKRRQDLEMSLAEGTQDASNSIPVVTANKAPDAIVTGKLTPHETAVRESANREVEKAAAEMAGASSSEQQSLARARLQDAQAFSRQNYSKAHVNNLSKQKKKMKTLNAAYGRGE